MSARPDVSPDLSPALPPGLLFALLIAGTVLGLAGTDLVLPAIPGLPAILGGTPAQAQLVLAAFVAGSGIGIILFGEWGARADQRRLLVLSLSIYGLISLAAAFMPNLPALIGLRFIQGAAGSAMAVFAPGIIRSLYADQGQAVRAMGLMGSIESLIPALAPIAGAWLLSFGPWHLSFSVIGAGALLLAAVFLLLVRLPAAQAPSGGGGYGRLLLDWPFLRYALSQALTLGGLLTFVFSAPALMTLAFSGSLRDFIIMQVTGILFFIGGANLSPRLIPRLGDERLIMGGTALSAAGQAALVAYGLLGGRDPLIITALFVPVNLGLGLRGPPGFMKAVIAAKGDDARGAALVILFILLAAALGTAAAAPFVTAGLLGPAAVSASLALAALLCLLKRA